jgi:hypothetical protein
LWLRSWSITVGGSGGPRQAVSKKYKTARSPTLNFIDRAAEFDFAEDFAHWLMTKDVALFNSRNPSCTAHDAGRESWTQGFHDSRLSTVPDV